MKALLFLKSLILFSSFCSGYAQPVISSDALIDLGEQEPVQFLDISENTFTPGTSGADQTWDFVNVPLDNNQCFYEALDASLSVFRDSFPNADVFFVCTTVDDNGERIENHTFYNYLDDIITLDGNVSLSITDPDFDSIFTVYTDPLTFLSFPTTFASSYSDEFEARVTTHTPMLSSTFFTAGVANSHADAYGTITTPAGTFPKTVRIFRNEINTITIPGIPISTTNEVYRYTWMSEGENYIIMNMDSIVVKDFNGNVTATTFSGFYRDRGPIVSTVNTAPEALNIQLFPNPAQHVFRLEFTLSTMSTVAADLLSIDGKVINTRALSPTDGIDYHHQFDVQHLPKGTYIVRLRTKGNQTIGHIPVMVR